MTTTDRDSWAVSYLEANRRALRLHDALEIALADLHRARLRAQRLEAALAVVGGIAAAFGYLLFL
jgi:hypothetical protein